MPPTEPTRPTPDEPPRELEGSVPETRRPVGSAADDNDALQQAGTHPLGTATGAAGGAVAGAISGIAAGPVGSLAGAIAGAVAGGALGSGSANPPATGPAVKAEPDDAPAEPQQPKPRP